MRRWMLATLALAAAPAGAMRFGEAFDAARAYDAQYQAAGHERTAALEGVPIARAGLLPNVNLNVTRSRVSGTREFQNALGQTVELPLQYASPATSLSLRTPLFNYDAITRLDQAQVQSDGADAQFRLRGYELADRLATAYVSLLLADETLTLSEAQVTTLQGQLARAEQRFARGEGTRVEIAQAQGSLDIARVRVLEAREGRETARRDLRRVTGAEVAQPYRVPEGFEPTPLVPATLDEWIDVAMRQNPALRVRELSLDAARVGVQRSRAGHMPRLDLVASVSNSSNESVSTLNQKFSLSTVGIQFSMPLYAGGGVEAGVRQAIANQSRAEAELAQQREQVQLEVQRNYLAVASGATKLEAYRRTVSSVEVALTGATRALEAGLGTTTAVLDAQAQVTRARRELAQARYEHLIARLRLMAQAGMPVEEMVADLDRQLSTPTVDDPSRKP